MARVSKTSPFRTRTQAESRSNTEGAEKEQTQSESEGDKDESTSKRVSSDTEEKWQVKRQKYRSINELIYGPERAKAILTGNAKPRRGVGKPISYARRCSKFSRSVKNNKSVEVSTEFEQANAEQKGKGKKQENDVLQVISSDSEPESEEVCKRINKKNSSDDDTDDNNGAGGGAHRNLPSQGFEITAGN